MAGLLRGGERDDGGSDPHLRRYAAGGQARRAGQLQLPILKAVYAGLQ